MRNGRQNHNLKFSSPKNQGGIVLVLMEIHVYVSGNQGPLICGSILRLENWYNNIHTLQFVLNVFNKLSLNPSLYTWMKFKCLPLLLL